MANTFFKAQGKEVGKSLVEDDYIETAARLLESANKRGVKVFLPVDAVVSAERGELAETCGRSRSTRFPRIPRFWTLAHSPSRCFESVLQSCKTIVWNGPMGVFETPPFNKGTFALAEFMGSLDALTVIGGGDSAAAIRQANAEDKVSYVSTGGGAFLELLEGKDLPGVSALERC